MHNVYHLAVVFFLNTINGVWISKNPDASMKKKKKKVLKPIKCLSVSTAGTPELICFK